MGQIHGILELHPGEAQGVLDLGKEGGREEWSGLGGREGGMVRVRVHVLELGKEGGREGWSGLGFMSWIWGRREGGRDGQG